MTGLLEGIRVIESASLLNGDTLGMLLGDLGADVIKIESPQRGDYLRDFMGQITPHNSPAHLQVNRNKRSAAIDIRTDEGKELFWTLLDTADVFIDGNGAGAMDRAGVGYADQKARKPDIIYCAVTGFGVHGPYSEIPTHGMMMTALVGANPMARADDGTMRPIPPKGLGGTERGGEATTAVAVHAALQIAAALVAKSKRGTGCHIDVAGSDAVVAQALTSVIYALNDARITDRSSLPTIDGGEWTGAKYQFYETRDRKTLIFAAIEHKFWTAFCKAIDREDLIESSSTGLVDFGGDETVLRSELQRIFEGRDLASWVELAIAHRIPMGPSPRTVVEMADDPHVRSREILFEGKHPDAGPFTYVGSPAIVEGHQFEVRHPAPGLGQHTHEVLTEIGVAAERLDDLETRNIISRTDTSPTSD
ncbi:CaiB/BaiF CoA transferase family protein [Rhodococcus rhodochrous]|uniref:Formyl-CoA transferase n=1 Tax=Rhodococcus rhodochrous KG-21 TaxID=1441923 RepID=A0A0M8PFE3_RHORH|nr:CaiB/BaiF CoA-transferase family protein [Rhodococcus rhodochrous]KOS55246.1 formyl-CoA transferase [Rhodococcus rhodochrous KG-21]